MIEVFGKVRTLMYLLSPADTVELENTITHKTVTLEAEPVTVGPLYHVYTIDFENVEYGEYQYKAIQDGVVLETGLLKLCKGPNDPVSPEDNLNIVMWNGEDNGEGN